MSFDPLFSSWVIALLCLPFGVFFWLEVKRRQKLLLLRLASLTLVFISVLGILLRPSLRGEMKGKGFMLLTPGFSKPKADSLLQKNPQLQVLRLNSAEEYPSSQVVLSHELPGKNIQYLLGEGLSSSSLDLLSSSYTFFPCDLPKGIVQLFMPAKVRMHQRNFVTGVFNASEPVKLKLMGPAEAEDSVKINPGLNTFRLSFHSKQPGLFLYSLISKNSSGSFSEKLPIEVTPERTLKILFVQKFPSAEVRYLKNYLTSRGHAVAVRTQTSKSNFNEEFSNMPRVQLSRLSSELLDSFDLIFLDTRSFAELSQGEKTILRNSIFNGLGLLLFIEDTPSKDSFFSIKTKAITTDTAHIKLADKFYVLPAAALEVGDQSSVSPVLRNDNRILTGYQFSGAGKIGFQLLRETYRVGLEGSTDDYAFIWSSLIEKLARAANRKFELSLNSRFPYFANEPVELSVISSGEKPSVLSGKAKLPLQEDVVVDDFWKGKGWPGTPGWHRFSASDSTILNYFVSDYSAWKSLRVVRQIQQTSLRQNDGSESPAASFPEKSPIPLLVFYLIFLVAAGFLWFAPKI
ncbi:hypothetical protein WSM22_15530 [Cytophagales bacterium WSM2-2]|nr:hypothetical protein WSM22_15530 [Cytophagales bacterium WSM2-2]